MKKGYLIVVFLMLICCGDISAQDLHYSQFYSSPLALSPANAGNFNGGYRVSAHLRNQWASVTVPYQTISLSGDLSVLEDQVGDNNWMGVGATVFYDKAGDGVLSTLKMHSHFTFHKHINKQSYFSVGMSFGYVNKSIDFTQLYFGTQWDGIGFDGSIDNDEAFESDSFGYLDIASGLSYTYYMKKALRITVGGAVQHINRPLESFYFTDNNGGNNQLGYRPVGYVTSSLMFDRFRLEPAVLYTATKKVNEIVGGTNVAFIIGSGGFSNAKDRAFIAGVWYRSTGSAIALAGFENEYVRVLLNYDIDVGALGSFSNNRNGFELSVSHVGVFEDPVRRMYCPRF